MSLPLSRGLGDDPERAVAEVQEQLGRLAARVVLLHLAVRRRGELAITEVRLDQLAASLREATEDARAVQRSLENGR